MKGAPSVTRPYVEALEALRREDRDPALVARMSELIRMFEVTVTLDAGSSRQEVLDRALLSAMEELQAARGALFVRSPGGILHAEAVRGLRGDAPRSLPEGFAAEPRWTRGSGGAAEEILSAMGLEVVCPISRAGRLIACLGLGSRSEGRPFGSEEASLLQRLADCAASSIDNGLMNDELQRLNHRLAAKVYQLNGLFDISRELTKTLDEEAIRGLVATTLLGQLMASRCVLYLGGQDGLRLVHERGVKSGEDVGVPRDEALRLLEAMPGPVPVASLPPSPLRDRLLSQRLSVVIPLSAGPQRRGFAAVGERASGAPFGPDDLDFAQALARLASAALETAELHRVRLEKERQDRELVIARGIQEGLLPPCPNWPGFDVAALSHPCQEVGGDGYDFIPIGPSRWALSIADVSGKGTPASILMASVHASLRALAGSGPLSATLGRLNRFLFESTQTNRFVTLFYAEIDLETRQVRYVNAGHVPPFLRSTSGTTERLTVGGPALGLLHSAPFEEGVASLQPGDTLAMVTDGATEALTASDDEFGDERVAALLLTPGLAASDRIGGLVRAIHGWTGPAGPSDDLTVLVITAL